MNPQAKAKPPIGSLPANSGEVRMADVLADFSSVEIDLAGFDTAEVFTDTTGIMDKEIFAPPRMVLALIGVLLENFGAVQELLDRLPPGATVHTTANENGLQSG
jgi:hypothetical protein